MQNRLVSVRFLPTTHTKGTRLKVKAAGHPAKVYGYHSFADTGAGSTEWAAASAYFAAIYPEAQFVAVYSMANPNENTRESLFLVRSLSEGRTVAQIAAAGA